MTSSEPVAVCLVTDANYILPTVTAALELRAAVSLPGAAVIVYALGLAPERGRLYDGICRAGGVELIEVTRDILGDEHNNAFVDAFFSGSKFTFGALGRFFLDDLLDPKYRQILYIDGDVQLSGSLDPLLAYEMAPKTFLAAPDPGVFLIDEDLPASAWSRAYMSGLGLKPEGFRRYFNSGVLRISRDGWGDIGMAAWEYLRTSSELCLRHDQSALNAVAGDRARPMSIKWNFAPYYRYFGLRALASPVVTHFMAHPKPWNGAFLPWGRKEHEVYLEFVRRHPETQSDLNVFSPQLTAKYILQQHLKRLGVVMHPKRTAAFRNAVFEYQKTVVC